MQRCSVKGWALSRGLWETTFPWCWHVRRELVLLDKWSFLWVISAPDNSSLPEVFWEIENACGMRVGEPLSPCDCFSWLSGMVHRQRKTSVCCPPHYSLLPSFSLLCPCFPFPTFPHIIITRWMWKSKTLAPGPGICWLYWTRQGWRYFINFRKN